MKATIDSIAQGWDLYGSDAEKIGTIEDIGPNYLLVRKGLIFTSDIYVPKSAVVRADADERTAYLDVSAYRIEDMGWTTPPDDDWRATGGSTGYSAADTDTHYTSHESDTIRVPRHEEQLRAEKQTREAGEVALRKDVVEEERAMDVPVTREAVEVRRVGVDRDARTDEGAFTDTGDTIRVPIREEQVKVTKEPRVVEEVEVRKVAEQDTERVTDTVRREDVDVEHTGDVRKRDRR
jgi:uncharacterized protein (TIGR02271 family)